MSRKANWGPRVTMTLNFGCTTSKSSRSGPFPNPRILVGGSLYLVGDVLSDNGTPPK
ncbi:hypothetical protein [Rhizobium laguerreae]|uniref:hypothetical protein n=1 Tax=Rhizobium laguerreae TaxID=1076926 RepID=UPI001C91F8ED|nr:hypothetical protein [Rhizobium laguerreae]MBY3027351.1 hypothetical protein [Rhizobium leguminosarum]